MPNVMVALPNIGGTLCPTPQMTPTAGVPCTNAAKTRNPSKFAGVPQTPEPVYFFASCIFSELRAAHFRPAF